MCFVCGMNSIRICYIEEIQSLKVSQRLSSVPWGSEPNPAAWLGPPVI
jgi:hypothetical protein